MITLSLVTGDRYRYLPGCSFPHRHSRAHGILFHCPGGECPPGSAHLFDVEAQPQAFLTPSTDSHVMRPPPGFAMPLTPREWMARTRLLEDLSKASLVFFPPSSLQGSRAHGILFHCPGGECPPGSAHLFDVEAQPQAFLTPSTDSHVMRPRGNGWLEPASLRICRLP